MQQILKKIIVLGLNMFITSSCGWLLWSYVDEIECLDTDKNSLCQQRPSIGFFTVFGGKPNTYMQQNLKMIIVLGVYLLFQGSCRWLLWSYLVEILGLDKDKTGYVNKVLIIHI